MTIGSGGDADGEASGSDLDGGSDESADGGSPGLQRVITATSVVVTLLIFSSVVWQAVTTPTAAVPQVEVVETRPMANGDVSVTVAVTNPSASGFEQVTASVDCTDPPVKVTFTHVPADARRTAHVVCPAWNRSMGASVSSWTAV